MVLALDGTVHGVGVCLELAPPFRHGLRFGSILGGRFLPAACQLGLSLSSYVPGGCGSRRPELVVGVGGFQTRLLSLHHGSERAGVICLGLVVAGVGIGRLLPGVGLGLGRQAQLAAHIGRRCGLRPVAVEHAGFEFAA